MPDNLFLGVDIGTTVVKATVIDASGQIVLDEYKDHEGLHPKPGWHEHDPQIHWWGVFSELVQKITNRLAKDASKITAIAVSGIFPTFCPADSKGQPLYNAILYDDARSSSIANEIKNDLGDVIYGNEILPRMIWFRENYPILWGNTHMVFWAHSYIVYKLTGVYCIDSHNAYVAGGVFDDMTFSWNIDKFRKYNLPINLLPPVFSPAKIAGKLDSIVAAELGLREGISVVTGTGDTLLSILGSGAHKEGDVLLNLGSVGVMVGLTRDIEYMLNGGIRQNGESGIKNLFIFSGFGKLLETLGSLLMGSYFTRQKVDLRILDELAASEIPSDQSLILRRNIPDNSFTFAMTINPVIDILGLKTETKPGEIFRAALECFGYEVRRSLGEVAKKPFYLCANGGGAKSKVWRNIISDITQLPIYFSQESTGAYGNALLAGYSTGCIDLNIVLNNYLASSDLTVPQGGNVSTYDTLYEKYLNQLTRS